MIKTEELVEIGDEVGEVRKGEQVSFLTFAEQGLGTVRLRAGLAAVGMDG